MKASEAKFQFARGWLDSLLFEELSPANARALADEPQTRLLRHLEIRDTAYATDESGEADYDSGDQPLEALAKASYLSNVRIFSLGQPSDPSQVPSPGTQDMSFRYNAVTLVKKMPNLEELYLGAHGVEIGELFALKSLKKLRILQVDHIEQTYPLDVLARNATLLENLTQLLIVPHGFGSIGAAKGDNSYLPLRLVSKLLQSPHLNRLTHLRLRLSDMADPGCEAIVQSGILKRLKALDIAEGFVTDDGARILAGCPDLKNLERLDVRSNWLTKEGAKALKACVGEVQSDSKYAPGDEESMYGGDME